MRERKNQKPMKRSFMATMAAVAWSFIGLRRKKDFDDDDAGALNPFYVIIAGLIGTAIFIAVLITIVSWVIP
jgi:hypothetical protein